MKKVTAAALTTMVLMTGSAFAAEFPNFDLNGDMKVHYRWNGGDLGSSEGGKVYFRLNATSELSKNVDLYARFATQKLTADHVGNDFSQGYYSDDSATSIDRFGFVVKGKNFNYTLGRQALTLGATGLLYSTEGYMGIDTGAIDGVIAKGKTGATDLKLVAGQGWTSDSEDPKLYAIDASYSPAKNWTVGATLVKGKYSGETANWWAVNAGYTAGKANFVAEYGKSDLDVADTAYALGVNYAFDKKHSAYAYYSNVELLGDVVGLTDFDPNGKGIYIGYDYKLKKDTTFSLFYKDMKTVDTFLSVPSGTQYDSFRATMTYKF